jgi:predicted nuclease of predicted toxin-antitoxin system
VRLLLDEMLSPAIARQLRERGHDVLAVADHPGWVALSDLEVMTLARTEGRAVVTTNLRDYRPLHADAITPGGPGHFGMIFMPGTYRRLRSEAR